MEKINVFRFRVRELREVNGYRSQKAFAEALGVAQTTVASWEGGKREPDFDVAIRIADIFCTSVDSLIRRSASLQPPSAASNSSGCWNGLVLKEFRERCGESPEYVADSIGVPYAVYESYEASSLAPSLSDLYALADHFCVDLDVLTGRSFHIADGDKISTNVPSEQQLLALYRSVNEQGKKYIVKQAEFAAAQSEYRSNPTSSAKSVG